MGSRVRDIGGEDIGIGRENKRGKGREREKMDRQRERGER